jgi:glycosyltransferase involved in cell wall biosynthesis
VAISAVGSEFTVKIAIVSPFPESGRLPHGGVQTVVDKLVRYLVSQGCECHVIAVNSSGAGIERISTNLVVHRLAKSSIPGALNFWTTTAWRIRRLLKQLAPDITHVHGAAIWAAVAPEPALLTIHGFPEREIALRAPTLGTILRPWLRFLEESALTKVRNLILINPYVRLIRRISPKHRVWEIPNPIDPLFFEHTHVPSRPVYQERRLVWVGNGSRAKNFGFLVDLVDALVSLNVDVHVDVLGINGDERFQYAVDCFRKLDRRQLRPRFALLGKRPPAFVRDRMDASHALILTSLQETAPCVVSEALARGLGVIGPKAFGLPYMLPDSEIALLFAPESTATSIAPDLAEFLARLTSGKRQRSQALANAYNLSRVGSAIVDVYREVANP